MDKTWLRKTIQNFQPYEVAPITVPIVINANESYQSLWDVPEVKTDLVEELTKTATNTYPLPYADELRAQIAEYVNKKPENILVGNGGDEIISLLTQAFVEADDKIVVHGPTFDMYEVGASSMGATTITVEDDENLQHDVKKFIEVIQKEQPKIVYLCNPNNPTGQLWTLDEIKEIILAAPKVVVVDEAYMEFNNNKQSILPDLENYPNVVVLRTLSKAFSLAGARLGYLVGSKEAISMVSRVKAPYNLNVFSQAVGRVALRHQDVMKTLVQTIQKNREVLYEALSNLDCEDLNVFKSVTNFLFVKTTQVPKLLKQFQEAGILIKSYRPGSALENYLRITVTTEAVNEKIIQVFTDTFAK